MIQGVRVCEVSIKGLYEILLAEGLPHLEDGKLRVFKIVEDELGEFTPVFSALPDEYMWVTALSSFSWFYQDPQLQGLHSRVIDGGYKEKIAKICRRSGVTQGRSIRGVLHQSLDPNFLRAEKSFPMGAAQHGFFFGNECFEAFIAALDARIKALKEYVIYPLGVADCENGKRWLYIFQGDWARHGKGSAGDRIEALHYANYEMKKLIDLAKDEVASLYFKIELQILFNLCSMSISWGGDTGQKASENELLWERVNLQAKLINTLEWPIFYPYISQHIDAQGDPFENIERWALNAPSKKVSSDDVMAEMRDYLRKCEAKFPSLTDTHWQKLMPRS